MLARAIIRNFLKRSVLYTRTMILINAAGVVSIASRFLLDWLPTKKTDNPNIQLQLWPRKHRRIHIIRRIFLRKKMQQPRLEFDLDTSVPLFKFGAIIHHAGLYFFSKKWRYLPKIFSLFVQIQMTEKKNVSLSFIFILT